MKPDKLVFPIIEHVREKPQYGSNYRFGSIHLVMHKSGFAQFLAYDPKCIESIADFCVNEHTVPQYFHIYDADERLMQFLNKDNRFGIRFRKRIQLVYSNLSISLDKKCEIVGVGEVDIDKLDVFNLDLTNRFWLGEKDFITNALGKVLLVNNKPVSICYASAIGANRAEIDVATLPAYRGLGYAKAVCKAFINNCIKSEIVPNWDCFEGNKGSLALAYRLGFVQKNVYPFLSIYKNNKR
jgi:RimJ/RimL family protein N-acetyltransferase